VPGLGEPTLAVVHPPPSDHGHGYLRCTMVRLPVYESLSGYDRRWLRGDLIAGLTVWAVLVPEALAYASIAGVSPVVGLYAAPPALVLYAAFGSSRHLVVGPMSATAALSAAAVADLTTGGPEEILAFTGVLAIVTGVLALAAGVLRLGFLAGFISEPVLKGFIIGLSLTIIVGQVPTLLGIEKEAGDFFEQLWGVLTHLGDTQGTTLVVGAASLAIVLGLRRAAPGTPGSLVAVAMGIVAVQVFDLTDRGVAIVGQIDRGLPPVGLPVGLGFQDYLSASAAAAGVMLVAFAEGLGAAKTYAVRDHYEIDANRELVGVGAANLGAGLCTGMVVGGSLSKTAVNGSAGARSQVSGIVVAVLTLITLLLLTGLFEDLPEATLAAVVIAAVIELVDISALRGFYRLYSRRLGSIYGQAARADFIAAVAAMFGVLVFDTLPGLVIGISVSLLLLLYRSSRPNVAELGRVASSPDQFVDLARHPENVAVPEVPVLRVEAGLFFANADAVRRAIKEHAAMPGVKGVVLDAVSMPFVDVTAVRMLDDLAADLERTGQRLVIAHNLGQVGDLLAKTDTSAGLEVFGTIPDAIAAVQDR
jgi:sulfate permease, SulP family